MMDEVLFSAEGGVGRITINRPEKRNALSPAMLQELRHIVQQAGNDPAVKLLAIAGAGENAFCAGLDLNAAQAAAPGSQAVVRSDFRQLLLDIVRCPKPSLALVRGHVMGGGVGIILATDLCLACDDVHLSTSEIKVGMFPMMVMGLLYRNVGRKKATEMMFLGEHVTAAEAQAFGIINHAYSRNEFDAAAGDFIGKLASLSSTILQLGKQAIFRLLDTKLPAEEEFLESALAEVMATEDSREGLQAFVEKRPAKWN